MTPEELEGMITQAANPDTAPIALGTLKDKVSAMITEAATMKSKAEEDAATIANLRDVNMRLFLRQTSTTPDETHEETVDELNERLRNKLLGKEA